MSIGLVLFIVFLVLKLTSVIAWSWLWVTAPLWLELGTTLVLAIFFGLVGAVVTGSSIKRRF